MDFSFYFFFFACVFVCHLKFFFKFLSKGSENSGIFLVSSCEHLCSIDSAMASSEWRISCFLRVPFAHSTLLGLWIFKCMHILKVNLAACCGSQILKETRKAFILVLIISC